VATSAGSKPEVALDSSLIVIGRVVFGAFFLIAGLRNFARFADRRTMETNYGFALPAPVLAAGFATQALGGLALILGVWTVPGAAALILFLALATPLFHNLFLFTGKEREPHIYFSLVNITLAAGLLMVIATASA
jgi:putative oxidoreductase